MVVPRWH
ncbi:hypothetical protein EC950183_3764, partial [Escherichia coli 95.0183]